MLNILLLFRDNTVGDQNIFKLVALYSLYLNQAVCDSVEKLAVCVYNVLRFLVGLVDYLFDFCVNLSGNFFRIRLVFNTATKECAAGFALERYRAHLV